MNVARGRFCGRGPGSREGWAGLGGSSSGDRFGGLFALGQEGLALHVAHFLFERALKIRGGLAELSHELAQTAGELRQLLWPENDQNHDKHHNHVRNAQHRVWEPSIASMGIIERVSAAVKPEFRACKVWYNLCLGCHARKR